jgi:hypothetical protein
MSTINSAVFENDLLTDERILWVGSPQMSFAEFANQKFGCGFLGWLFVAVTGFFFLFNDTAGFVLGVLMLVGSIAIMLILRRHAKHRYAQPSEVQYAITTQRVFVYAPRQKSTMFTHDIRCIGLTSSRNKSEKGSYKPEQDLFVIDKLGNALLFDKLKDANNAYVLALLASLRAEAEFVLPKDADVLNYRLSDEKDIWRFSPSTSLSAYLWQRIAMKFGSMAVPILIVFILAGLVNQIYLRIFLYVGVPFGFLILAAYLVDLLRIHSRRQIHYVITNSRVIAQIGDSFAMTFIDSIQMITHIDKRHYPDSIDLHTPGMPWLTRLDDPDAVMRLLAELQDKAKRERAG